jgi:hypothetical protein
VSFFTFETHWFFKIIWSNYFNINLTNTTPASNKRSQSKLLIGLTNREMDADFLRIHSPPKQLQNSRPCILGWQ